MVWTWCLCFCHFPHPQCTPSPSLWRRHLAEFQGKFHTIWGQFMKTGYQNSRFANQIGRFACLYTSHVGNLAYYSPNKSYRALQDELPHDALL